MAPGAAEWAAGPCPAPPPGAQAEQGLWRMWESAGLSSRTRARTRAGAGDAKPVSPVCARAAPAARAPVSAPPESAAAHAGPTRFPEWSPLGREVGGERALRSFLLCQQKTAERGEGKLRFAWVSSEPGAEINARRGARGKRARRRRRRRGGCGGARCEGHRRGWGSPPSLLAFCRLQIHSPPGLHPHTSLPQPQIQVPIPFPAAQARLHQRGSLSLPSIPLDASPWAEVTGDSTGDPQPV